MLFFGHIGHIGWCRELWLLDGFLSFGGAAQQPRSNMGVRTVCAE